MRKFYGVQTGGLLVVEPGKEEPLGTVGVMLSDASNVIVRVGFGGLRCLQGRWVSPMTGRHDGSVEL